RPVSPGEGGGSARRRPWSGVQLCAAGSSVPPGRASVARGARAAGQGRAAVSSWPAARSALPLQARPRARRRLRFAAEEHAPAASHAYRHRAGGRLSRHHRDRARGAGSALHRGGTRPPRSPPLLTTLPDTPERRQQELTLLTALGTPLVLTKGHAAPEVETTYTRARALCQQLGDAPQLFSTLLGLRRYHQHRGELRMAHELGEALLRLAERLDDVGLVVRAHHMLAETMMLLGEFGRARAHAEQGLALYDPLQHRAPMFLFGDDSGVGCRVFGAQALWALGYPDQARQWSAEALAWAEALAHPFNMVFVLTGAARLHRFLREPHQVRARADAAIVLAQEQGFAQFLVQASIQRGGALAEQGQVAEGLAQIRQGLTAWQATRSYTPPHKLAVLGSVY